MNLVFLACFDIQLRIILTKAAQNKPVDHCQSAGMVTIFTGRSLVLVAKLITQMGRNMAGYSRLFIISFGEREGRMYHLVFPPPLFSMAHFLDSFILNGILEFPRSETPCLIAGRTFYANGLWLSWLCLI